MDSTPNAYQEPLLSPNHHEIPGHNLIEADRLSTWCCVLGWDEDRSRARARLRELERVLEAPETADASPDAKLAVLSAAVNARALLLCADTARPVMDELNISVLPPAQKIFGPR